MELLADSTRPRLLRQSGAPLRMVGVHVDVTEPTLRMKLTNPESEFGICSPGYQTARDRFSRYRFYAGALLERLAQRELSPFLAAIAKLYGPEQDGGMNGSGLEGSELRRSTGPEVSTRIQPHDH